MSKEADEQKSRSFNYWKLMAVLLVFHLIVPSYYSYEPFPSFWPSWGLSWIAFGWAGRYWLTGPTWGMTLQYAFQGFNAFLFYGLEAIIPLMLLVLMLLDRKVHSNSRAFGCLVLSSALSAVYLYGRYLAWVSPFAFGGESVIIPTHTVSIILFTLFAYKNWSTMPVADTANKRNMFLASLHKHRIRMLIAATILILVAVGASAYQYYQWQGARDALNLLSQEGASLPTDYNYELFVSVDVDRLPKPSGEWIYRSANVTYHYNYSPNQYYSHFNDTIIIAFTPTSWIQYFNGRLREPVCTQDVLLVATSNIPDYWLTAVPNRPYYEDMCYPSPSPVFLHLHTPNGQPVHWHLYLFLLTPAWSFGVTGPPAT